MAVKHEHIVCVQQGDTIRLPGTSLNVVNGTPTTPLDLTGAVLEFIVAQANSKAPAWSWNSVDDPDRVTIPEPEEGKWLVELKPEDSQAWGADEWLTWQARFTFPGGFVRTLAKGTFRVERELPDGG